MKHSTRETFKAWAIESKFDSGWAFLGRYWQFGEYEKIPIHMEGCRIALFTTRQIARNCLRYVNRNEPHAGRVARVTVTIRSEPI